MRYALLSLFGLLLALGLVACDSSTGTLSTDAPSLSPASTSIPLPKGVTDPYAYAGTLHNQAMDAAVTAVRQANAARTLTCENVESVVVSAVQEDLAASGVRYDEAVAVGVRDGLYGDVSEPGLSALSTETVNALSDGQRTYVGKLLDAMDTLTGEELIAAIDAIARDAQASLSADEVELVAYAAAIARASVEHWSAFFSSDANEPALGLGCLASPKGRFWNAVKRVAKADLIGAVKGAVSGAITGYGIGVGALAGAAGGSAGAIVKEFL